MRVVPLAMRSLLDRAGCGHRGQLRPRRSWPSDCTLRCPISTPPSTSYSLVGSWWQARKHIANWWLWIVVDLVYIGEYIYKDLWLTAVLYAGLVGLAVLGLRDWQRAARRGSNCGLNHVAQRLAGHIAAQFVGCNLQRAPRKLRARSAHVRRDQQIRDTSTADAQPAAVQDRSHRGRRESCRVAAPRPAHRYSRSARAPHSPAALPAASAQTVAAPIRPSRLRRSTAESARQPGPCGSKTSSSLTACTIGIFACRPRDPHQLHVERLEHALDLLADRAITDQQHRLAGQFLEHHRRIQ